jgi:SAM-dependent methyltransferase
MNGSDASVAGDGDGGAVALEIAAAIVDLSRRLTAATPPPRDAPFFGLDVAEGICLPLLEALTARGIFRKYEFVLDLGTGLGGASRWLALRRGCRVLGLARSAAEAAGAALLTRRAGLADQVGALAADARAVPIRDARFTHVWSVEALVRVADKAAVLREAFRVLRPGALFAAQETVVDGRDNAAALAVVAPSWHPVAAATLVAALRAAGFTDVLARDVTSQRRDPPLVFVEARTRLAGALGGRAGRAAPGTDGGPDLARLAEARRRGELRTYHLTAQRPA